MATKTKAVTKKSNSTPVDRVPVIKQILRELDASLKVSLDKAIQVGHLLTEQKKEFKHGEFLPWLTGNFAMSQQTASNYMRLYKHKNKLLKVGNLQEAYRLIKYYDEKERTEQAEKDEKIIAEYKRTGKKPKNWERRHDNIINAGKTEKEKESNTPGPELPQWEPPKKKTDLFNQPEKEKKPVTVVVDFDVKLFNKKHRLKNKDLTFDQEIMIESIKDYVFDSADKKEKQQKIKNLSIFLGELQDLVKKLTKAS